MKVPPPLSIIDVPADKRHTSGARHGGQLELIVFHATADNNLENVKTWLSTNPNSDVSIPRLIDKQGQIYKIVGDETVANHVGYSAFGVHHSGAAAGGVNPIALGIEFLNLNNGRDPYTYAQIKSGALQVREWYYLHGFHLKIVSHANIDTQGKTDPYLFPWELFYKTLWGLCNELW